MGILLYLSTLYGNVVILKKLSMIGIFIIFYLIIVFAMLLPKYHKEYKDDIKIVIGNFD